MVTTWIVPGAPLEKGEGWRIWYSSPGHGEFTPGPASVFLSQRQEEVRQDWEILPDLAGLDRRMGVLTLKLAHAKPGALYDIHIPEAESSNLRSEVRVVSLLRYLQLDADIASLKSERDLRKDKHSYGP